MSMLDDAIQAIRMGDREEGRRLLEEMLETDEGNEDVWLWLTTVVDSDEDREVCLENVLAINPNNTIAQRNLNALKAGNFNPADIARSAISEDEEEEEPATGATFLDEFRRAGEEPDVEEDDELVMPSTMAKSKTKGKASKQAAQKKGGGFKLNPRLIILAVFVLLIICALGSLAAYNLVGGGLTGGETGTEAPAGGGEVVQPTVEPAATDTPPEPPTNTPQPTKPSLELPTPKPTDLPTPTSTPVVLPTVS
ncbi:MAG: hypothetical protein HS114_32045 [Anaerolineales bacterium]|nr:hypothetical protein [Anaerolineales bacterium]